MSRFYFAHRFTDEVGLSFAFVYIPQNNDIQISLMLGCLMLAVGYKGGDGMNMLFSLSYIALFIFCLAKGRLDLALLDVLWFVIFLIDLLKER